MSKRSSYNIKKDILHHLQEQPATYAILERKVNTGYRTIKANCQELQDFGQVTIKTIKKHPSNGRAAHVVSITAQGSQFLQKQKKKA